jgi:peptide methionine sulfoxide reductase MsrB
MTDERNEETQRNFICCQRCGTRIGHVVMFSNKEFFIVNGIAVTFMRGVCLSCQEPFNWDIGQRALAKLIQSQNQ